MEILLQIQIGICTHIVWKRILHGFSKQSRLVFTHKITIVNSRNRAKISNIITMIFFLKHIPGFFQKLVQWLFHKFLLILALHISAKIHHLNNNFIQECLLNSGILVFTNFENNSFRKSCMSSNFFKIFFRNSLRVGFRNSFRALNRR